MNILYLCYWGIDEGLTEATVLPHVRILASFDSVTKIILSTIERSNSGVLDKHLLKVEHKPLFTGLRYVDKINDFVRFPGELAILVKKESISLIIARGAPAGALAYLVHQKNKTPFVVESFEPHSEYMRESGVWRFWDPRYLFQKFWERQQRKYARWLLPVAHQYKRELIRLGVNENKVMVVPCAVDFSEFNIHSEKRQLIRTKLGADDNAIVGVYVGKFGGIYWDDEAFYFLSRARKFFKNFKLIVLSPNNNAAIKEKLVARGFGNNEYLVTSVGHSEVSGYLSAADLAFSFYRPSSSKRYLSPIKVGEYWACGLPVMLGQDIGDDSEHIEERKIGAIFTIDSKSMDESFNIMLHLLQNRDDTRMRAMQAAREFRSFEHCKVAYQTILNSI